MKKHFKKIMSVALSAAMLLSTAVSAFGATTDPNPGALELKNAAFAKQAALEGMVLLENNGVLPMAREGNVALFGVGVPGTVKGGTGSGDVYNRYTVNVRQGFENAGYKITTNDEYYNIVAERYAEAQRSGSGMWSSIDYASLEEPLTAATVQPKAATETALYVIARNSGEGADRRANKGDFYLNDVEYANIKLISETYKNVIVVINSGGIIGTAFFDEINEATADPFGGDAIDSLFLMSQAGQESGNALVEVLNGTATPSGKLTDSWADIYDYYPASETFSWNDDNTVQEDYVEGLYVGYRYFDSFYKSINPEDPDSVVNYPFGFGLSYTDFDIDVESVTANMDTVTVVANVTNAGTTYSGKEVVEVYFSAPQEGLDKPYQELAAFGKTEILAPGQCQTLTITFQTTEMSSYNEELAAYVMDGGDYIIRVGNSSRNTQVGAVINLPATTLTEQLSTQLDDESLEEWTSDPANFYSYEGEAEEIEAAAKLTLDTTGFVAPNNASAYAQDVPVDEDNYYYSIDRGLISSVTTYLKEGALDWEGTGEPYVLKTGEVVEYIDTDPANTLYDVYDGAISMEEFVAGLTVAQMASIVEGGNRGSFSNLRAQGAAGYTTAEYEDLGIAGMILADGPAGVRITQSYPIDAPEYYQFCTAWPIGTMLAQTWNMELVEEVGKAIGEEMYEYGVTLWLAPSLNIHRDPLCGRNFEYYSEDPFLAGMITIATTEGVQTAPGVGVTLKHYASNNQEQARSSENNTINERTYREIYLKGFEMAVKATQPMAVMSSYNRAAGTYTAGDYDHQFDILRGEWGFKGLVMTDWGGVRAGIVNCMYAGNDLIEPGGAVNDVINATLPVDPTIDVSGLPRYIWQSYGSDGGTSITYSWSMGNLVLDPTAETVVSTTIDETTDLTVQPTSGQQISSGWRPTYEYIEPHMTVNNAYNHINEIINNADVNFSDVQKAAIVISDVQRNAADEVTSYTISLKGRYVPTMRLGDLQRSVRNILNIVMQSKAFEEVAHVNGRTDISVGSYTAKYADELVDYLPVEKGDIQLRSYIDLGKALAEAEEILADDPNNYTTTWEAMQDIYNTAKAVYELPMGNDSLYRGAYEVLQAYIDAITLRADNADLVAKIDELKANHSESDYTPETWAVFADAIAEAEAVTANRDATALEINQAMLNLILAQNQLEYNAAVNKQALQYVVDKAKAVLAEGGLTPGSQAAVEAALAAAEAIIADAAATKEQVDQAMHDLLDALNTVIAPADKAWLETLIGTANAMVEGKYTAISWGSLATALVDANSVYSNEEASQAAVDAAADALWNALNELKFSVDMSALESAIEYAQNIVDNSGNYVPSTIGGVAGELAKAKAMLAAGSATAAEVEAQAKALLDLCANARKAVDKSRLKTLSANVGRMSLTSFNDDSVQPLLEQFGIVDEVLANENAEQADVDKAYSDLLALVGSLELNTEKEAAAPATDKGTGIIGGGTVNVVFSADPRAAAAGDMAEEAPVQAAIPAEMPVMDEAEAAAMADAAVDNAAVPTVPTVTPADDTSSITSSIAIWIVLAGLVALAAVSLVVWRKVRSR